MQCVYCGADTRVTRTTEIDDNTTRRERRCKDKNCGKKFYTLEHMDSPWLFIRKSTGNRENYQQHKLRESVVIAAGKPETRILKGNSIDSIVGTVERGIIALASQRQTPEINSKEIGKLVLKELREADFGAFLRYLSVFSTEIQQDDELRKLIDKKYGQGVR